MGAVRSTGAAGYCSAGAWVACLPNTHAGVAAEPIETARADGMEGVEATAPRTLGSLQPGTTRDYDSIIPGGQSRPDRTAPEQTWMMFGAMGRVLHEVVGALTAGPPPAVKAAQPPRGQSTGARLVPTPPGHNSLRALRPSPFQLHAASASTPRCANGRPDSEWGILALGGPSTALFLSLAQLPQPPGAQTRGTKARRLDATAWRGSTCL